MQSSPVSANKSVFLAVLHLQAHPPGTELPSSNISEAIGAGPSGNVGSTLIAGVKTGLLNRRLHDGLALWSLGPNASQATEAPARMGDGTTQTVVRVSAMAAPSIFAFADERAAAPFSCSLSTDGRLTIERYGRVLLELTNHERKTLLSAAKGVAA